MLKAFSTYAYVRERLHPGLLDGIVRAGAEAIEIFAARGHFDYANRRQHVLEIANWFKSTGIPLNSVHAPMFSDYEWGKNGNPPLNIASNDRAQRIAAMDEIKRAVEIAEHIPFRFLIQHVGVGGEMFDDKKFDAAMTSVEHLKAFAKPLGVKVVLENIPNEMSTPERLVEFLNITHFHEDVGFCFDIGHAHIMSSVEEAFALMKPHIRTTHLHDNGKDRDAHLWPGEGSINWNEAMQLLRTAPHVPPMLLEIDGESKPNITQGIGGAFSKLADAGKAAV
ncbi:MAG TPA: sugar phosphate isomerase/epimerase family protein [Terriglobales bacterium]|nr:sugar phosphate isomerase/epimerase family protein [Terriglobales bacterium]